MACASASVHGWPETPSGDWRLAEAIGTQEHVESEERIMPNGEQPRRGPIPISAVIKKTLSGIVRAQEDYEAWSGGYWLWTAPEYMQTVYIAKEISTIPGRGYLTLESGITGTMEDAGGFGKGKLPKSVPSGGRTDITLRSAKGTPRAVIEVKRHVRTVGDIEKDIERIRTMLRNKDNTLKFGLIAFYTSCWDRGGDGEQARLTIEKRLDGIKTGTSGVLKKGDRLSRHDHEIIIDGDSAWTVSVLKIQ